MSLIDPKQDRRVSPAQEVGQRPKTQRETDQAEYALGDRVPAGGEDDLTDPSRDTA